MQIGIVPAKRKSANGMENVMNAKKHHASPKRQRPVYCERKKKRIIQVVSKTEHRRYKLIGNQNLLQDILRMVAAYGGCPVLRVFPVAHIFTKMPALPA